jgi:exonuclease SbcC
MRPLAMRLKGFTAFRDEQSIDFSDLDLFALSGPTGSGKSSLLDAITYALYGKAERVEGVRDARLTEMISQGQPRMAVELTFETGGKRLRVTRTTMTSGHTKARLEIADGDEWRSYGEGADLVRDVNRLVIEAVGLDYDAFTRSVILPQGKFQEFLIGDSKKRRDILTELLGLSLFERMSARANEVATRAKATAETTRSVLDTQFADVTDDGLSEARAAAREADEEAKQMTKVSGKIARFERQGRKAAAEKERLAGCVVSIEDELSVFKSHHDTLAKHSKTMKRLDAATAAARKRAGGAEDALRAAVVSVATAEQNWGTTESLALQKEKLAQLTAAKAVAEESAGAHEEARAAVAEARKQIERAEKEQKKARARAEAARAALDEERARYEEAERADLVGALVHGLEPGAPCPVCGNSLAEIPENDPHSHEHTRRALQEAETSVRRADNDHARAEAAVESARESLAARSADEMRCKSEAARRAAATAGLEEAVAIGFGGRLPDDAGDALDRRLVELRSLIDERDKAQRVHGESIADLAKCERDAAIAASEVTAVRTMMSHSRVPSVLEAAAAALPESRVPDVDLESLPDNPDQLANIAEKTAGQLSELSRALAAAAEERDAEIGRLGDEARDLLPDAPGGGLEDILAYAQKVARAAGEEAVRRAEIEKEFTAKIEKRRALEADIETAHGEHQLFKDLALHLRRDRIVDYLQAEALAALAGAGSDRLSELSGGRYRLGFDDDRFFVVDSWNGEERRNIRTLSGGETFLASLSLALALSEQVQLLSVTEKHRLDSLFLDEGFGTLDAETLEVVVGAIEQLGGDGRLVGVITHVADLADRLPVKIEVQKSPRGSRLEVGSADSVIVEDLVGI